MAKFFSYDWFFEWIPVIFRLLKSKLLHNFTYSNNFGKYIFCKRYLECFWIVTENYTYLLLLCSYWGHPRVLNFTQKVTLKKRSTSWNFGVTKERNWKKILIFACFTAYWQVLTHLGVFSGPQLGATFMVSGWIALTTVDSKPIGGNEPTRLFYTGFQM